MPKISFLTLSFSPSVTVAFLPVSCFSEKEAEEKRQAEEAAAEEKRKAEEAESLRRLHEEQAAKKKADEEEGAFPDDLSHLISLDAYRYIYRCLRMNLCINLYVCVHVC